MSVKELVKKNRSYRRFEGNQIVEKSTLVELIDLARLTPSGRNVQSLRFFLSTDKEMNDPVFDTLGWAGYLPDWPGPIAAERPAAYIVVTVHQDNKDALTLFNAGLAVQSILLGAVEKGLGGCIIASVKKEKLTEIIGLKDQYEIICVIALGKPVETVVIDEMKNNEIKYWRDAKQVHHVPKRNLQELILNF